LGKSYQVRLITFHEESGETRREINYKQLTEHDIIGDFAQGRSLWGRGRERKECPRAQLAIKKKKEKVNLVTFFLFPFSLPEPIPTQ
jgi:hypothetical protein